MHDRTRVYLLRQRCLTLSRTGEEISPMGGKSVLEALPSYPPSLVETRPTTGNRHTLSCSHTCMICAKALAQTQVNASGAADVVCPMACVRFMAALPTVPLLRHELGICSNSSNQCDQDTPCSGGQICDGTTGCCASPPACTIAGSPQCDGTCTCDFTTGCCPAPPPVPH